MNNEQMLMEELFSYALNEAIQNQNMRVPMPEEQKEKEKKILDAIHDIISNMNDIEEIYRPQVRNAMILKMAEERNRIGGKR